MLLKEFFSHANWLAIGVAALAYFVIGALWYSVLFRKPWMEGHKLQPPSTPEEQAAMKSKMPMMFSMSFLMGLVAAMIIGMIVMALGSVKCLAGMKLGLALGGLATIPLVMSHLYMMKPMKVWFIDGGYHIVSFTLMTIIISVWH